MSGSAQWCSSVIADNELILDRWSKVESYIVEKQLDLPLFIQKEDTRKD